MFYAGGIVFLRYLRGVCDERMRAMSGLWIALAFMALASGCGILRCGGTAVYGVAISVCA